ncbi:molybdopterin-dependent oxidoreductase [Streptomonospora nanhaiensis]|uniref:Molybdopterin-dependent oxidoreductase n=1 Tax=Streptomonospora nanhaiensis TaxID=1323731 RepID=A0ABY6YVQ7_9ACTN|nr:molybdopterin-dependent oxidoreductase [Streptomonospora nanhaiensis]WAE76441.1 molybdopterin-dependent oxidoreductase [Streptomonospora nanhaiensis]
MPHVTTETRGTRNPPRDRRRTVVGTVVGLLSVGASLGSAELASALARTAPPVIAVGDAVVDNTPPALMELAISLFGTADKVVLLSGIAVVLLGVGAVLGVVALRRPAVGYAGLAVFAAAGIAAVLLRRADEPGAAIPVLVGAAAGASALALLLRSARGYLRPAAEAAAGADGPTGAGPQAPADAQDVPDAQGSQDAPDAHGTGGAQTAHAPEPGPAQGPGRRGFVLTAAGVLAASGTAGALGRLLPSALGGTGGRSAIALPAAAEPLAPLPSGTDLGVPGLSPFSTPAEDFYRIDTALTVPRVDASRWTLRVHGMVDRPFEIDMEELLGLPLVEADITLACVSNQVGGDLAGNTRWLGHPLADLLRRAGVHADADQILSTSHDGWTCGTPTEVVMDGRDALLAVGMGGEALTPVHGHPARMVVPGLYGFVSATKWVTDIELTRFADEQAYWAQRGWAVRAPIKTMSRVDVPAPLGRVGSGEVVLAGVAWAQHRGVDAVEVRVDDGAWQTAELARVPGIDTWVQWVAETVVDPGRHTVEVRATDSAGRTQPPERVDPVPNGATGWHRVRFTAE